MSKKDIPYGLKTTPLFDYMYEQGGNFTGFGGYYMPVNFKEGIVSEHLAVRNDSGLFDISHMGEIKLKGKEAEEFLNYVSTNNVKKISSNQMQYNIIMQDDGGAIDDLMVYKFSNEELWLVCNAANQVHLLKYLQNILKEKKYNLKIIDESDKFAAIAIQGPKALTKLNKLIDADLKNIKYLTFETINNLIVSRSGYTGEDGFEIYGPAKEILDLTKSLVDLEVMLCGLGSRDTLRFEAGLPLFGHEISGYISPVQAGLNFAIDYKKENFIGKEILMSQKANLKQKVYGMELLDRGVLRQGYPVYDSEENVGYITSGFMIPGTKNSYANGLINSNYKNGDILEVEVRNRRLKVRLRRKKYL